MIQNLIGTTKYSPKFGSFWKKLVVETNSLRISIIPYTFLEPYIKKYTELLKSLMNLFKTSVLSKSRTGNRIQFS